MTKQKFTAGYLIYALKLHHKIDVIDKKKDFHTFKMTCWIWYRL